LQAIGRLVSSYDPYQTGFVRYIKLSASILAGNRPSMSGLISSLNNGILIVFTKLLSVTIFLIGSKAQDEHGVGIILALIYGLYQDCQGEETRYCHIVPIKNQHNV
jgi:hypothetical protein